MQQRHRILPKPLDKGNVWEAGTGRCLGLMLGCCRVRGRVDEPTLRLQARVEGWAMLENPSMGQGKWIQPRPARSRGRLVPMHNPLTEGYPGPAFPCLSAFPPWHSLVTFRPVCPLSRAGTSLQSLPKTPGFVPQLLQIKVKKSAECRTWKFSFVLR